MQLSLFTFCFHTCKKVDKIQLMFEDYETLE